MSMMNTRENYGSVARVLHWLLAALVIGMLTVGLLLEDINSLLLFQLHKFTGLCVLAVAILTVIWGWINVKPTYSTTMPSWQQSLAKFLHNAMLFFVFIMPLTGWYFTTAGGKPPQFFSLNLPMPWVIAGQHPAIRDDVKAIHIYVAYALIALVILHTLAALKHHFIDKDTVLKRMLR